MHCATCGVDGCIQNTRNPINPKPTKLVGLFTLSSEDLGLGLPVLKHLYTTQSRAYVLQVSPTVNPETVNPKPQVQDPKTLNPDSLNPES